MSEDEAESAKDALSDLRQWAETGDAPATIADCEGLDRFAAESLVGYEKLSDGRRLVLLREAIRRIVTDAQGRVLRHIPLKQMSPENKICRIAAADDILDLNASY